MGPRSSWRWADPGRGNRDRWYPTLSGLPSTWFGQASGPASVRMPDHSFLTHLYVLLLVCLGGDPRRQEEAEYRADGQDDDLQPDTPIEGLVVVGGREEVTEEHH